MQRRCIWCNQPITHGCMTCDGGEFYAHEGDCFEWYMNRTYGKHKWMSLGNGEEDSFGGYYIHSADVVGGYEGTGIYYTEYDECDLEDDD